MQHQRHKLPRRAPRITVPNDERVLLAVGHERFAGILFTISLTGGSMRLSKQIPAGTFADITMDTTFGAVAAAIELLPILPGTRLQPFRFVHMDAPARQRLENALEQMRNHGFAHGEPSSVVAWVELADRAFGLAKKGFALLF